ncbi:MAG: hypothetical protein JXB46_00885 [Candidatus Eisenbacteria bacterium]|nr:hypothetical protein [Candidatus Eisenbacteria bacterium]
MHARISALSFLVAVALVTLSGCGSRPPAGDAGSGSSDLPLWVRLSVPVRGGRALFVGGVSAASDTAAAIAAAEADAESQLHYEAARRSNVLFDRGNARSDIETTALERLAVKNSLADDYAERMVGAATRDSVYYRLCGDAPSGGRLASTRAVCQAFVLISVDESDWDTMLAETLAREKSRRREEGQNNLAELAEWLMRQLAEESTGAGREPRQ